MSAEIRKYQYFIAIAEEKSITQAAKRLYISQPALTQYLHNLETEMGVKLFERFGSQYLPTAAGQIYLKGAYAISAIDRETQNQINETKNCDLITFTIALSHSQNVHRIHYLFLKMKEKFPNIRFHVLERTSEDCPDTIASGMAEIGIVSQPCSLRAAKLCASVGGLSAFGDKSQTLTGCVRGRRQRISSGAAAGCGGQNLYQHDAKQPCMAGVR